MFTSFSLAVEVVVVAVQPARRTARAAEAAEEADMRKCGSMRTTLARLKVLLLELRSLVVDQTLRARRGILQRSGQPCASRHGAVARDSLPTRTATPEEVAAPVHIRRAQMVRTPAERVAEDSARLVPGITLPPGSPEVVVEPERMQAAPPVSAAAEARDVPRVRPVMLAAPLCMEAVAAARAVATVQRATEEREDSQAEEYRPQRAEAVLVVLLEGLAALRL